jgi:biotin carboxyl carrier protein
MAAGGARETAMMAPMPGLVVNVRAKVGDTVKKNQPVVVMEAMKMENVLKAPVDGKIKAVHVSSGQSVEKGEKLVEFE